MLKNFYNLILLEFKLFLIFSFVDKEWFNQKKIGKRFHSRALDRTCLGIGEKNYELRLHNNKIVSLSDEFNKRVDELYIVTKIHESGGHTAILNEIISNTDSGSQAIIITGVCGPSNIDNVKSKYSALNQISIHNLPTGGFVRKLTRLQSLIDVLKPKRIWLFNHPQDVVAISGIKYKADYQVIFYHHVDDRLCLGASLNFAIHVDSNIKNFKICKAHLKFGSIFMLPLGYNPPIQTPKKIFDRPQFVSCTAARQNKFLSDYEFSYAIILGKLLYKKKGKHFHVGKLSFRMLNLINLEMRRLGIPSDKFVYVEYVHSIYLFLIENNVDLYLSSFPYGAGLTIVEAMAAGVPVLSHRSQLGDLFGGSSLLYPGAMQWNNYDDFDRLIKDLTPDFLSSQSIVARQHFFASNSPKVFLKKLKLIRSDFQDRECFVFLRRPVISKIPLFIKFWPRYSCFRNLYRAAYFLMFLYFGIG